MPHWEYKTIFFPLLTAYAVFLELMIYFSIDMNGG